MPKQSQVLEIEPKNEICFKGPFTQTVTEYFKLTNPSSKKIAFKVKTTAPKRYCVRPNNGSISPGQTVSIAIMLQATDGTIADKNKHKFLIQSVEAPEGEFNHDDLFKSVDPDTVMDSKFKCVFDDPSEQNETHSNRNVDNIASDKVESEPLKSRDANRFAAQPNAAGTRASNQSVEGGHFSTALSNEQDARRIAEEAEFSGEELNDNIIADTRTSSARLNKDEASKNETNYQFTPSAGKSSPPSQRSVGVTSAYVRPSKLDESSSMAASAAHNVSKPSMVQAPTREVPLENANLVLYLAVGVGLAALVIGFILGKTL